ncbi:MAG: energy-coupling factor transporter ATPase [Lachnospiraceae bacterium]|nr:energy-coupling factor transporter ATPase [Lachnospiraceae bacterium]
MVTAKELTFEYIRRDADGNPKGTVRAVDALSLHVKKGQFIAIVGHNGSGKSTFARLLNVLLAPAEGTVFIDGMDTRDESKLLDIRMTCGMVFQNPDNQIIGQVVEEDVAFGPENMGVPTEEIRARVDDALRTVGMYEKREASPNKLSGGQKQRVSIAGVIAMHPKCIVLDEPTAMLDPKGREEVLKAAHMLNRKEQITIILITHHMEETVDADRIFVMDKGRIAMDGTPEEIFSRPGQLKELHLSLPQATELGEALKERGVALDTRVLKPAQLVEALCRLR